MMTQDEIRDILGTVRIPIITGPSGSGKTTLSVALLEASPHLQKVRTTTTRKPREYEVNGVDYNFVSVDTFLKGIEDGIYVEHQEVYSGTFYGTPVESIQEVFANGKHPLMVTDVYGAQYLRKHYPTVFHAIFIDAGGTDRLAERLKKRGDTVSSMVNRLSKALTEISLAKTFCEFSIYNHNGYFEESVLDLVRTVEQIIV